MNRRGFLKLLGLFGLTSFLPGHISKPKDYLEFESGKIELGPGVYDITVYNSFGFDFPDKFKTSLYSVSKDADIIVGGTNHYKLNARILVESNDTLIIKTKTDKTEPMKELYTNVSFRKMK